MHAASCMNQKHLLRFIKKCLRTRADEPVCLDKTTGEPITLKQVRFAVVVIAAGGVFISF